MPPTTAPDHAKMGALQYLHGFGESFLTSSMHTMPFDAAYTGGLSQPLFFFTSYITEPLARRSSLQQTSSSPRHLQALYL